VATTATASAPGSRPQTQSLLPRCWFTGGGGGRIWGGAILGETGADGGSATASSPGGRRAAQGAGGFHALKLRVVGFAVLPDSAALGFAFEVVAGESAKGATLELEGLLPSVCGVAQLCGEEP